MAGGGTVCLVGVQYGWWGYSVAGGGTVWLEGVQCVWQGYSVLGGAGRGSVLLAGVQDNNTV